MGVLGGYSYWKVVLEFLFGHPKCHFWYPPKRPKWVHPPGIRTFSSTSTGTSISTTLEENNGQSGAAVHSPLYNKTSWCGSVPLITVIIILSKFNPIFCSVLPHKSDLKPTRGLIVPGKCKKLDNNPNIAKGTTAPRVEWFLHKSWSNPSSESWVNDQISTKHQHLD